MNSPSPYLTDPETLPIPWTESPFYSALSLFKDLTYEEQELVEQFHRDGYVILDLSLSNEEVDRIQRDVELQLAEGAKTQEADYHYSDSPRVFEAWRKSLDIARLSCHPKVLQTLRLLYGREPVPFQTINFLKGTNQPAHSDTLHFHTLPERWVAACWVALEHLDEGCGPLSFYPGSHRLPVYDFPALGIPVPEYGQQFEAYAQYEQFIRDLIKTKGLTERRFYAGQGQAIIWAANLLHGGSPVTNPNATRWSQVTHYYFEGCREYYCPMFSDLTAGKISRKDLAGKDIRKAATGGLF